MMFTILSSLSLLIATPAPAHVALQSNASGTNASGKDLAMLCREFGSIVGFQSVGECLSLNRSNPRALAAMICNAMEARGGVQAYGWRNVGECVNGFRDEFPV